MIRRRNYWIQPGFQSRMISHWSLLVLLATTMTYLVTIAFVVYQDRTAQGAYFYVSDLLGSDPIAVKRHELAVPALVLAGAISFLVTWIFGVFYSHRVAGPLYRIQKALQEANQGKRPEPIQLRKHDELKDLAKALNQLFGRLP